MLTLNIKHLNVSLFLAAQLPLAQPANESLAAVRGGASAPSADDFTKLDADDRELPADAGSWAWTRDNRTGLIWSSGNVGGKPMTWAEAEQAVAALGNGARLATVDELQTLLDRAKYNPAMRGAEFFVDPQSSYYWTSSPVASAPACAWIVSFDHGGVPLHLRYDTAFVRAVRGPVAASQ
jgi:hypothetical protein